MPAQASEDVPLSGDSPLCLLGPKPAAELQPWLAKHQPSLNLTTEPWYWVRRPRAEGLNYTEAEYVSFMIQGKELWDKLVQECERIKREAPVRGNKKTGAKSQKELREAEHAKFAQEVGALARQYHILSGKWLFMPSPETVDALWAKLATAVAATDGALAHSAAAVAKVSTHLQETGGNYVICLYCNDSWDKQQVESVFRTCVDELGVVPPTYKADAYTHLDIYSGNKAGMKTTLYSKLSFMTQAEITAAIDHYHSTRPPTQAGNTTSDATKTAGGEGSFQFPGHGNALGASAGERADASRGASGNGARPAVAAATPKKRTLEDELADGEGEGFDDDDEPETDEDEPSRKKR